MFKCLINILVYKFILGKINEIKKDSKILEKWFKC